MWIGIQVAISYLNAKQRSAAVREAEEMKGVSNKTCWVSIVLGFKRGKEVFENISLWGKRIQVMLVSHTATVVNIQAHIYFRDC